MFICRNRQFETYENIQAKIMAPLQAIPIFGQMGDTSVQVSHLWSTIGCHIWPTASGLTSIIVHGLTWIVASFWPLAFIESDSNNGPSLGHSSLSQREHTPVQVSYLCSPCGCNIWPRPQV